ncbi:hypothetical protein BHM03_00022202 [Ensete ventricosum]|nr:hypothetical protein BHM03_00022202 [Ensete ventricosum]
MHTARYWAVSPIGAVTAPLPPEIDRYRKKKREKKNLESDHALSPCNPLPAGDLFSPREEKKRLSMWGEGTRQCRLINSLTGTNVEWLYHILHAFNTGNLLRYQELCRVHNIALRAQPALVENEKKLLEKINILCLMEIISRTVASYDDDLLIVSARWYQVKNVHLIEGIIDQVEGTVHVSWVQPRVLGIPQIRSLRGRLDTWVGKVRAALLSVEAETPDLVACA